MCCCSVILESGQAHKITPSLHICYNTVVVFGRNTNPKLTATLNVPQDILLGLIGCKGIEATNDIFTMSCCTDPKLCLVEDGHPVPLIQMHNLSLKHVMKAK